MGCLFRKSAASLVSMPRAIFATFSAVRVGVGQGFGFRFGSI